MAIYDYLIRAPEGEHVVQFFDDEKSMFETVCLLVFAGLRQHEGILVIGSPTRFKSLCDSYSIKPSEQLVFLDAEKTISQISQDGSWNEKRFKKIMSEPILALKNKFKKVRVWGGIVNHLWDEGNKEAAYEFEAMWERLLPELPAFFLLHTYVLNPNIEIDAVQKLCGKHSFAADGKRIKALA